MTIARHRPPDSAEIQARHRTDGNRDKTWRNGFGLCVGGRKQGDEIAGAGATRFHFRKQHRRNGGHVGGL
jgi:hypothetical protein